MRRFNFMLNGSRLMMFPFYIGILICVILLMVKFAMQLYQLSVNIFEIPYLDLITGVLTLVDFILVAQMLILVAICGYVQFIQTEEQRASLSSNWLSKIKLCLPQAHRYQLAGDHRRSGGAQGVSRRRHHQRSRYEVVRGGVSRLLAGRAHLCSDRADGGA